MVKWSKGLIVLAWLGLIFVSSSVPSQPEDPSHIKDFAEWFFDKDAHLFLYGILAYLIVWWLSEFKIKFSYIFWIAVLFGYFFGITDEWHQGFVPNRGVSFYDLLFDVLGAGGGVLVYWLLHNQKKIKNKTGKKKKR